LDDAADDTPVEIGILLSGIPDAVTFKQRGDRGIDGQPDVVKEWLQQLCRYARMPAHLRHPMRIIRKNQNSWVQT